jgi:hypothetical protein
MDLSLVSTGLLLAVLAAISLGALLKGMTGLGLPLFAVPALVFTRIGISLSGKISVAVSNRILLAVFVAMELKLIVDIV